VRPRGSRIYRRVLRCRLWAATGQAALEGARVLVAGASATGCAALKNLVLPGVGHFTLLDAAPASGADAGNNFFLEGARSIGKPRAEEAARLLRELNDGVDGVADTRGLGEVLVSEEGRSWIRTFSLVIVHNVPRKEVEQLAALLWADDGPPLCVVRSAGFIAEFFFQFRRHEGTLPPPSPLLATGADGTRQ
jgi:amyloid beta precursor protein binding protein 1